jgi:23S rRNA pseudouridine2457 synthase
VAFTYLALHKPYGVVTQFSGEHPNLSDYVSIPGVYPAGRLDKDSEGLLLLSDDGGWQHRVTHPKFEHEKTYWVQVEGVPDEHALEQLRQGVAVQDRVQDYVTKPAKAQLLENVVVEPRDPPIRYRASIPDRWLALTIREGRNRQVRRMCAAVGYPVLRLIRVAIGPVALDGLKPGQWRTLSREEVGQLAMSPTSGRRVNATRRR